MGAVAPPAWFLVEDESAVVAVRRAAAQRAEALRFPGHRAAEVAAAATLIATHLCRNGARGTVHVRQAGPALEIIAVGAGRGLDVAGLGGITGVSDWSDAYSHPERGTVFAAGFRPRRDHPDLAGEGWLVDGLVRPVAGEELCGDGFAVRQEDGTLALMLCDGLGHGPMAAAAADVAIRTFEHIGDGRLMVDGPGELLERIHKELRETRGAAVAVAVVSGGILRYSALGNVSAGIVDEERRALVSLPGIAGHRAAAIREFEYPLPPGALIVMHSDGVRDRWELNAYPGLRARGPLVIAATLLRDMGVPRDDAGILVAKPAS
ncbi:SpoIIE family protein phosphatase [Planotetraspora sp. A-T 1434]|uniref:SpoIIE family protein phosphatase n=1 Tax=Planotetraspora sp. A-T 1434 TaxID=2979219 RepID=UPI0021BF4C8A|nr:SpoIIE family protein phosphatase [Planotetraspora sp. A-T 1434]MCT9931053.1 SpoIIE family protein phosphatase [Planotetraspora sp. A-T 1434]